MAETENAVGRRVREARETMGWTVRQVAAWTGIDPATVSRIETGVRPATEEHIRKLAAGLKVTTDWLLGTDRKLPDGARLATAGDEAQISAENGRIGPTAGPK